MLHIVNNGNKLANDMHFYGLIKDGQTIDELYEVASKLSQKDSNVRYKDDDDFWVDFAYRAEELGYKLKA